MACYLAKSSFDFHFICLSVYPDYSFEYIFGFYIFYLSVACLLPHQLLIPPLLRYRHAYVVVIISLI